MYCIFLNGYIFKVKLKMLKLVYYNALMHYFTV